jgi:hypothetical protein
MKTKALHITSILLGAGILLALAGCGGKEPSACGSGAGNIKDEALCVGRAAESFPGAD